MHASRSRSPEVAIVGTGAWGTTLSILLSRAGRRAVLCTRTAEEAQSLEGAGQNALRLPGVPFPPSLRLSADWKQTVAVAPVVVLLVPAQRLRENAARLRPLLRAGAIVVHGAKGLEAGSLLRMTEVLAEELPEHPRSRLATISGPNLAREIAAGKPAATVVAAPDLRAAESVQTALMTPDFRVYTSTDVVGVELAGALKNIIALGAGVADGLEVSNNAKAALITRGLAEIARLGVAMGAQPMTFAGLAGLGDLVATCYSPLSRNRFVGQELAAGRKLDEILSSLPHVAEGVWTTRAAFTLAREHGVEMPIVEQMHRVLFEGADPRQSVGDLMNRPACEEWPDLFGVAFGVARGNGAQRSPGGPPPKDRGR